MKKMEPYEVTVVPSITATVEEVTEWLKSFEGGRFAHPQLVNIASGYDLFRLEKADFGFLGTILGPSLYAVLHPPEPQGMPFPKTVVPQL